MTRTKKIKFSEHALIKRGILWSHGFPVETETVEDIIRFPEKVEMGYKNRRIAKGESAQPMCYVWYTKKYGKRSTL